MDVVRDKNVSSSLFDVVAPPRQTSSDTSGRSSFQNLFAPSPAQPATPARVPDDQRSIERSTQPYDEQVPTSNQPNEDRSRTASDASSSEALAAPADEGAVDAASEKAKSPPKAIESERKTDEKQKDDAAIQVAAAAAVVDNQKPVLLENPSTAHADEDASQVVDGVKDDVAAKESPDSVTIKDKLLATTISPPIADKRDGKESITTAALANAETKIEVASSAALANVETKIAVDSTQPIADAAVGDTANGKSSKAKGEKARGVATKLVGDESNKVATASRADKTNPTVVAEAIATEEDKVDPTEDAPAIAPDASSCGKREIGDLPVTAVAETKADPATKSAANDATTPSTAQPAADTAVPVVSPTLSLPGDKPADSKSSSDEARPIGSELRTPSSLVREASAKQKSAKAGDIDPAKFIQRVARAFQSAHERQTDVKIRLSPPELGSLSVEVKVTEGTLSARLRVETPEAKAAVLDNLPVLRERLQEQGIRIDKFDVDIMDHSDHQPQQPEDRTPRDEAARRAVRSESRFAKAKVETSEQAISASRSLDTKQINVVI